MFCLEVKSFYAAKIFFLLIPLEYNESYISNFVFLLYTFYWELRRSSIQAQEHLKVKQRKRDALTRAPDHLLTDARLMAGLGSGGMDGGATPFNMGGATPLNLGRATPLNLGGATPLNLGGATPMAMGLMTPMNLGMGLRTPLALGGGGLSTPLGLGSGMLAHMIDITNFSMRASSIISP